MNRNCPNCGAPYSITEIKCPYCSTTYMDLTDACFEDGVPMYLRVRSPFLNNGATILMKCIPRLGDIEFTTETNDLYGDNYKMISYPVSKNVTMNMSFDAIENEGTLFKIITD